MPFRADTPTPEFVGNFFSTGARSPPGTQRDLTTPSLGTPRLGDGKTHQPGGLFQSKAGNTQWSGGLSPGEAPGGPLRQSKAGKSCARLDFRRVKSGPETFAEQSPKVCPAGTFAGESLGPGSGREKPAAGQKPETFFLFSGGPTRIYKRKRGLLFRKKTVDFSAWQSDGCTRRAGNRP